MSVEPAPNLHLHQCRKTPTQCVSAPICSILYSLLSSQQRFCQLKIIRIGYFDIKGLSLINATPYRPLQQIPSPHPSENLPFITRSRSHTNPLESLRPEALRVYPLIIIRRFGMLAMVSPSRLSTMVSVAGIMPYRKQCHFRRIHHLFRNHASRKDEPHRVSVEVSSSIRRFLQYGEWHS